MDKKISIFDKNIYLLVKCLVMKQLVIVESPSKAKTIEKYLGKNYKVLASIGHIRDLPKSEKNSIDIESGYIPNYIVSEDKKKIIQELKKEAEDKQVLLATDPDREGEAIAWHLQEVLNNKDAKRIVFYEITENAVLEAIEKPRDIDQKLFKSQEARRVLDRLFGYGLSGLIWKKLRYGLSAGRVQSPALRILVEKEKEIIAFKPVTFWDLLAIVKKGKDEIIANCEKTFEDKKELDKVIKLTNKKDWEVKDVVTKSKKRNPNAPFITSTLQQAASNYFGYSPSNTMRIAQKLYEAGHITYMRTDSTRLSNDAHSQIGKYISQKYGKEYYSPTEYKTKKKTAQEAHEAIRPTKISVEKVGNASDERKLYELIHKRTVATQMISATIESTNVICNAVGVKDGIPNFKISGSRIIDYGWMKCDNFSISNEVILPKFNKGDKLELKELNSEEKETTPPPRYTEAGLVKELEKRGIGRPSTYASILKVLVDRQYVNKQGKTLIPTDTGIVVNDFLDKHFNSYITDKFTSNLEDELDEIANGNKQYVEVLDNFYKKFQKDVDSKQDIEKMTVIKEVSDDIRCPKCGAKMVYKLSRNGTFMSCVKFPDCDGARTEEGKEIAPPKKIGKNCPKCDGDLVKREGRYGMFVSCDNYPKCKYVEEDEEEKKKNMTDVTCTECNKGKMMERRGRFGIFYSCENYPDCKHAIKAKPTGRKCEDCNSLMMEGTKTIPERCSVKTCKNHRPDKK